MSRLPLDGDQRPSPDTSPQCTCRSAADGDANDVPADDHWGQHGLPTNGWASDEQSFGASGAFGPRDRLRLLTQHLTAWLDARPSEVVGLSIMLAGAVAASVLIFAGRPVTDDSAQHPIIGPAAAAWDAEHGTVHQPPTGHGSEFASDAVMDTMPGSSSADGDTSSLLTVHVSGAVRSPGVIAIPHGARVGDVIVAAGGARWSADLDAINLARPVADGEQVRLPFQGELAGPYSQSTGAPHGEPGVLDINTASADDLTNLPGIGPTRASAIVAHRERHGPFRVPGDLRAVSGIGEATFQNLAEHIVAR